MLRRPRENSKGRRALTVVALSGCLLLPAIGTGAQSPKGTGAPVSPAADQGKGTAKAVGKDAAQASAKAVGKDTTRASAKASDKVAAAGSDNAGTKTSDKSYKGFLIRQYSDSQGAVTIYACPHRWALKSGLISIIVDEEKDRVIAYTRRTDKYVLDTVKVGMKRFASFRRGGDFDWGPFSVVGHQKWHGQSAVVLERKGRRNDFKVKDDVIITERQISSTSIMLSKVFEDVAYALFDVEYRYGMPLNVSRMAHSVNPKYCTVRPVITLDTTLIKEETFAPRDFDIPKGLTRVKTEIDLMANDFGPTPIPIPSASDRLLQREKQLRLDAKP